MDPITNLSELLSAIDNYYTTPRIPPVTGAETNAILKAMITILTGTETNLNSQLVNNYLSGLPGFGPGRVLLSDFTWASYNVTLPQLAVPAAFDFGTPTTDTINISWNAITSAQNYILQSDTTSAFLAPVLIYAGPNSNFTVTGLQPNYTYYFRVKAIANGYQDSSYLINSVSTA